LYGYVYGNPINLIDPYGLDATCTQKDGKTEIEIPIKFSGEGATPDVIKKMISSIESAWSTKDFSVKVVEGTANNIAVEKGKSRSYVTGSNGGVWGADNDPWVAAHEAGHLMKLPDDYQDNAEGKSIATPGTEGNMMSTYKGTVKDSERKAAAIACGCK
jgi:hypothetical protein